MNVEPELQGPPPLAAEWAEERGRRQNPRVRAFLGCIRLMDEALETDYHLLNCAPRQLVTTLERLKQLSEYLRTDLRQTLAEPSEVAAIEAVRKDAEIALTFLEHTLLTELESIPEEFPAQLAPQLRKALCEAMGQLQVFIYENFSRLVAADPRSAKDWDEYLARCLPGELEEGTWLFESLCELSEDLELLDFDRRRLLEPLAAQLQHENRLPSHSDWHDLGALIGCLEEDLTIRLKEILSLHGIRHEELIALRRYSVEIPARCRKVLEAYELGGEILGCIADRPASEPDGVKDDCAGLLSRRLAQEIGDLDLTVRDLSAWVSRWKQSLESRLALQLEPSAPPVGQSPILPAA